MEKDVGLMSSFRGGQGGEEGKTERYQTASTPKKGLILARFNFNGQALAGTLGPEK
jgi:hypothetical protein